MSIFTEWLIQTPGIGRISAYRFRNLLPNEEDFAQKIYTMSEQKLRELAEEVFQDKERAERCLLGARRKVSSGTSGRQKTEPGSAFFAKQKERYLFHLRGRT